MFAFGNFNEFYRDDSWLLIMKHGDSIKYVLNCWKRQSLLQSSNHWRQYFHLLTWAHLSTYNLTSFFMGRSSWREVYNFLAHVLHSMSSPLSPEVIWPTCFRPLVSNWFWFVYCIMSSLVNTSYRIRYKIVCLISQKMLRKAQSTVSLQKIVEPIVTCYIFPPLTIMEYSFCCTAYLYVSFWTESDVSSCLRLLTLSHIFFRLII